MIALPVRQRLAVACLFGILSFAVPHAHAAAQAGAGAPSGAQAATTQTGPSGLPLPRFVSLKSDRINVRAGPGQDHRVAWIFAKAGLPVEIIAEYENWRRIRDSEGAEGWIFHSLLSGRRTAVVAPWSEEDTLALRRNPGQNGGLAALVEPKVLVDLNKCDGTWCRVTVNGVSGWISQEMLWGVYPREIVE
ncbi:SH3 domain-containing protein [Microbaculum marinisediminis]|uniref:SH3 domain-containing protein n=1 Tax=Microbaculum marinisediminis TaxID=2931392 RepID=UPI003CC5FE51